MTEWANLKDKFKGITDNILENDTWGIDLGFIKSYNEYDLSQSELFRLLCQKARVT